MYAVSNTQTELQKALEGVPELLPEHIEMSRQEAIFAWNQRKPISDKAFELVNRLMAEAVSALKG